MPCREAIWTVVTSEWDVSVEEIPWYFAYAFGTKAVYKVLEELEQIESVQKSREARKAWSRCSLSTSVIVDPRRCRVQR